MTSFLESIADRLLEKFPDSMEGIAIVLPSKRSIVFLKSYIAARIDKPIFLPRFFSVEEFIESLSGLKVIDNLSLQFYLYQSYLDSPPSKVDSFDEFLNWGSILLHDFNEVDRNLVDVESIFTNLKEVKDLENWNIEDWSFSNDNLTLMQNDYLRFFELMYHWYNDFSQSLLKEHLAYQGLAYREAAKEIKNLDEIRALFLEHPFVDFTPEWKLPDIKSVISFLCDDFSFNRARVEKALELYVEAKPKGRQFTLGDF